MSFDVGPEARQRTEKGGFPASRRAFQDDMFSRFDCTARR